MTHEDKELIKQEIERLKHTSNAYDRSRFMLLLEIEEFIASLPEESASDDLEEEITKCYKSRNDLMMTRKQFGELVHHFAEWQKNKMKEALQTEYEKGRFDMREEMMKTLVEGEIVKDIHNQLSVKSEQINDTFGKFGDKVKIIIIKQD